MSDTGPGDPGYWDSLFPDEEDDGPPAPLGGVPEGYIANRPVRPSGGSQIARGERFLDSSFDPNATSINVSARYREGDQYGIYSMTPDEIAAMQRGLVRAGLLDPDDIQAFGYVGPAGTRGTGDATYWAYTSLLEFANQAGYSTASEALRALQTHGYGTGPGGTIGGARSGGGGGGGLPARVSNADDLRRVFRASVIDTLGEGWTESQIDAMVQTYQAMERGQVAQAEQMALDAARQSEATGEFVSSGTLEELPDPATFAADQARQRDPAGAQARDFLGVANQFYSLLGEWNPPAGEMPGLDR